MRHATQPAKQAPNSEPHRHERRRQQFVLAAYRQIAENGFEGLRVREVAAHAGVNIATLHYYFATKEDLIQGVVDYLIQQFLTREAPIPPGGLITAPQRLRQLFLDLHYQLREAPEIFAVLTELHLRAQRDAGLRKLLKRMNDDWQAHIEEICQAGIHEKAFYPDLNSRRAAALLAALIKGLSLQALSGLAVFDFERLGADVERWFSRPSTHRVKSSKENKKK